MSYRLENKRALVTGGSRGIGAAIVKRLAQEGAHVALTYAGNRYRANETVKAAQALGVKALAYDPTYLTDGIELSDDPLPALLSSVYALSAKHRQQK